VIAVEPENENYELLLQNTGRYPDIKTVRAAMWGSSGEMELRDTLTGPWGYTVCDIPSRTKTLNQKVPCITVRELMNQFQVKEIGILKLDCEGAEKSILEHAQDWIGSVSVLTAELHDGAVAGCNRAFSLATRDFLHFEKAGEKVTAYNSVSGEPSCRT
jgi:FkbM family methyltransferase